ncbi:MAG: hypothetical protein F7B18_08010 [Desulfurococcales archaeon]|nr:hypothetical protein [Desulfurococcales archaeon]
MPRYGARITIVALLLILAIMLVAYKVYQPPPQVEEPPRPPLSNPLQDKTSGIGPGGAPTPGPSEPGQNVTGYPGTSVEVTGKSRPIARITASITGAGGQAGEASPRESPAVTPRPSLDIDIGFLRSVKPLILEHEVQGRVVDVQLVDINDYCVKCGLLITIDTGRGVEHVLAFGYWEAEDRVIGVVNLLLYIKPGDQVFVEALRDSYEYQGGKLYIAYEIEVPSIGIELERVSFQSHHGWHGSE